MKLLKVLAIPVLIAGIALAFSTIGVHAAPGPLVVTKSANVTSTNPGGTITYTITVRNSGDQTATAVVLTDMLDPNLQFVSSTPSGTVSGNSVSINLGDLTAGTTATATVVGRANSGLTGNTTLTNTATADASNTDPATSNSVSVSVTQPGPSIIISKMPNGPVITAGGTLTYDVTVRNIGSAAATGVIVSDILDPATTLTTITPTPTTSNANGFTFSIGTLAAQGSFTFRSQVLVNANTPVGTAIDNNVRVTGDNFVGVQAPSAVSVVAGSPTPTPSVSATPTSSATPRPSPVAVVTPDPDGLPGTGIGTVIVWILIGLLILSLWPIFRSRPTDVSHQ